MSGGGRQADLVALVGSRICHDLISPLGAVGNGLELLQMMGTGDSPEMALVSDSVVTASDRVKLFRLAFGAAAKGQRVAIEEARAHAAGIGQGRISIRWTADGDVDRMTAKLGLLLLLCAETLTPYGGEVDLDTRGDRAVLTIRAERLRDADALIAHLADAGNPLPSAGEVHFPLARMAADDMGRRIAVERDAYKLTISA